MTRCQKPTRRSALSTKAKQQISLQSGKKNRKRAHTKSGRQQQSRIDKPEKTTKKQPKYRQFFGKYQQNHHWLDRFVWVEWIVFAKQNFSQIISTMHNVLTQ